MPIISEENLTKLMLEQYPDLKSEYAAELSKLFQEIRKKCDSAEISTKALDLRGLLASVLLVRQGLTLGQALEMGITNKSFDAFERSLVEDIISARIDGKLGREELFVKV